MITDLDLILKGAQHVFSVTDLATFGKGLANGMPLSALVGKREIMSYMEDIFSGTFGGETLSLAAANAVIDKYKNEPVIEHIASMGSIIHDDVMDLLSEIKDRLVALVGHVSWKVYNFPNLDADSAILYKSILIEQLAKRGILTIGSHNISFALTIAQANQVVTAYKVFITHAKTPFKWDYYSVTNRKTY